MANPEHLKILKQGVAVWNEWRQDNPQIRPDLSKAEVQGVELPEINFESTNLEGANMKRTMLYGTNFDRAI